MNFGGLARRRVRQLLYLGIDLPVCGGNRSELETIFEGYCYIAATAIQRPYHFTCGCWTRLSSEIGRGPGI
jgi:hypothetical protein